MVAIGRLLTAMVTPFDEEGEIDYAQAGSLAKALVSSGSDGLVIGGTTGESPSMSDDEKLRLFAKVKEAVGDTAAVIAGTTDYNHRKSVALSQEAERLGVDGLLLTVPAYNKPQQEGLYQHFKAIAGATSLPGLLYNVPSRTALNMTAATTLRLAQIDNIIGIKEATAEVNRVAEIRERAGEEFLLLSGDDATACDFLLAGGHGVISVTANVAPRLMHELCSAVLQGDAASARDIDSRLQALHRDLFLEANPIPVKWAVHELGLVKAGIRLPLTWLSEQYRDKVKAAMNYAEITIQA